ncbi:MAG: hypothetical protein C5S38_06830 [Candidatus Methanophagaceae archaeon]|nr:MAG: hypothetical protein C5S38_06830 [Methanophagales archaeon]
MRGAKEDRESWEIIPVVFGYQSTFPPINS